jgi:hypothetical protein
MIATKPRAALSYRVGQTQVPRCPGCGNTNWLIGRKVAECAFCELALPLAQEGTGHASVTSRD